MGIDEILTLFPGESRTCANITLILDDVLESVEFFQIVLRSDDPQVTADPTSDLAIVFLTDSTGNKFILLVAGMEKDLGTCLKFMQLCSYMFSVLYLFFLVAVSTIGFSETSYSVNEADGFLEVCVVLNGRVERPIFVNLDVLCANPPGQSSSVHHNSQQIIVEKASQLILPLYISLLVEVHCRPIMGLSHLAVVER